MSAADDVYVVSSVTCGEQEGVVAVFDTKAVAERFAEGARKPSGCRHVVTTWRLNVADWTRPEYGVGATAG